MLSYVVLFGCLVAVPFFLENTLHVSPLAAGLELTALPVSLAVVAPARRGDARPDRASSANRRRHGRHRRRMALLAASATRWDLTVVALAIAGAGMGLFVAANNAATMFAAPQERAGAAGGS